MADRTSRSWYSHNVSSSRCAQGFFRSRYEGRQIRETVARRLQQQDDGVGTFEVLLVRDALVHRHERVEFFFRQRYELSVIFTAPAPFPNGEGLVLFAEETLEPVVEVLVKQ